MSNTPLYRDDHPLATRYSDIFRSFDTNTNFQALVEQQWDLEPLYGTRESRKPELSLEYQEEVSSSIRMVDEHSHVEATAQPGAIDPKKPTMPQLSTRPSNTSDTDQSVSPSKLTCVHDWTIRWFRDWWGLEIISMCLSTMCIIAIIIMLWKVDKQEMPKWRLGVTIDAVLSLLSGFSKSCLLMPTAEALGQLKWIWFKQEKRAIDFEVLDKASRGTWGSLSLLARTRGVTLASIGAAIILLSVPLDLFYQQIVRYPLEAVLDKQANATVSRAILYDPDLEREFQGGEASMPPDTQLDAFLWPYWRKKGPAPGVAFDCPTGNCTWDPFHTLAVDFQCAELPNLLEFGCKNTSAEWHTTVTYQGPGKNPNMTSCGWYLQLPGADLPQLMSGYEVTADRTIGEVLTTRFFPLSDVITHEIFFGNESLSFQGVKHPVVDFILVSTPGSFNGAMNNQTPVVTECELHWVVKKIQSTVTNGQLSEHSLETLEFSSDVVDSWDPNDNSVYLPNFSMTLPDPQTVKDDVSTYGMTNWTARKAWQVWAEIAPSSFNRPSPSNPINTEPVMKQSWLFDPPHLVRNNDPVLPWDAPANVTAHMAEIITVMNQVLRRNTLSITNRHDVAVGKAFRFVVFVHVKWQWIAFPAALWSIAFIFLVATMYHSSNRQQKVEIWKNSALPILLDREKALSHQGTMGRRLGSIRKQAKNTAVQLRE